MTNGKIAVLLLLKLMYELYDYALRIVSTLSFSGKSCSSGSMVRR